jgi:hypothetical protein
MSDRSNLIAAHRFALTASIISGAMLAIASCEVRENYGPYGANSVIPLNALEGVTRSDLELANALTFQLLDKPDGSNKTWNNPDTGNQGAARVKDIDANDFEVCRKVTHRIRVLERKTEIPPQIVIACKRDNNAWEIVS